MVYEFFDKKSGLGAIATSKAEACVNEELTQELYRPVIKNFKRRRLFPWFKDNIWAAYLPKMGSLPSFNRSVKYLLCLIDVFTKYAYDKPLKDKKAKTVFYGFIEIVNES